MVCVGTIIGSICSINIYIGQDRYRWREFKSGNSDPDGCGARDGVGNGISYKRADWNRRDKQEELVVFDLVRIGDRCFLALLL